MPYSVDFVNVSTVGLESSPVAEALAAPFEVGFPAGDHQFPRNQLRLGDTDEVEEAGPLGGRKPDPTV